MDKMTELLGYTLMFVGIGMIQMFICVVAVNSWGWGIIAGLIFSAFLTFLILKD